MGEDGIEFAVCDVGNDIVVRVPRTSVRRAERLNTADVIRGARVMFACVTRPMSRKVNDDVIAVLDLIRSKSVLTMLARDGMGILELEFGGGTGGAVCGFQGCRGRWLDSLPLRACLDLIEYFFFQNVI